MTGWARTIGGDRAKIMDYVRFLKALISQPKQTASIVPSSPYLGRLMAEQLDPAGGPVMEFGGGTGALTRQILARGIARDQLEVVEINPHFARQLRIAFPGVRILETPAQMVAAHSSRGIGGYQAVVSGLPLLAMGPDLQLAIIGEAFRLLAPGGSLLQFTYGARPPLNCDVAEQLGLDVVRVGHVLRNVPPATVFRYTRAAALLDAAADAA